MSKKSKKAKLYENGIKFDCIEYEDEDELAEKMKKKYG